MNQANNNDLTNGSLSKSLLRLAVPMFISAILQNLQSIIDLFWVGKLGASAVAAISMSGVVMMLFFPVIMAMSTGTVAYVSRYVGAGKHNLASDAAGQSLLLAFFIGLIAGVIGWFFSNNILVLLGAAPDVAELGTEYLEISFLGSFTLFLLMTGISILNAAGNTILPMTAMLIANIINLVLDPILIFGLFGFPRMEVQGAALATIISQVIASGIVISRIRRGIANIQVGFGKLHFNPDMALKILRIGNPSLWQFLSRSLMALVLMRIVASCGTASVAAYGIGLRFHMIILMPAFTLGNAAATIVGQNLGAGNPHRANAASWLATGIDTAITLLFASIVIPLAPTLIGFFNSSPEVVSVGAGYLRTVTPFYIFAGLSIILGRAMNGAGETIVTMVLTIICLWGIQVPLAVIFSRLFHPATQGIWWAIAIAFTVHGLTTMAWFQTGRWKHKRLD